MCSSDLSRTLNVDPNYVIHDGNGGDNYTVTLVGAFGTITPAPLTLAAVTDSKVYDGSTSDGLTPTVTGLVGNDSITDLIQLFSSKNAGSRTLSVDPNYVIHDGNGGDNYTVTLVGAFGTITPAPLTLAAVTDSKVYDGNDSDGLTPTVTGLVGNDSITDLIQLFSSKNAGSRTLNVDPNYVIHDGNGGDNYTVTLVGAFGTITPAPLTLAAVTDSKVYDGNDSDGLTPTVTGLIGNNTISNLSQIFDSKNAGSRTLNVDPNYVIHDGNGGDNYTVTLVSAFGTITPAPLTLAAVTDSKVYGGNDSDGLTPTVTGLIGNDTISNLSQIFDSKNAGNRTLNVDPNYVIRDGNHGDNYTVTLVSAFGTITPAPLTLAAVTDSKVYDGSTSDGLNPTVTGLVGGDTIADLSQSFNSKNAGNRTLSVNGGYVIQDGNGGDNYTVTLVGAFGTITPAPLTLAAVTDSKVYDGSTSDGLTPTVTGLVGNDTISDLLQTFSSRNAGSRTLNVDPNYVIQDRSEEHTSELQSP